MTWCRLSEVDGGHFCSVNISSMVSDENNLEPLNDLQIFQMSLCGSEDANTCRLMIEEYEPQNNSRQRVCLCSCCVGSSLPLHERAFINMRS